MLNVSYNTKEKMNSTWMMKSAFNKSHGSRDTMRGKHNCKSVVKHFNTATGTGTEILS